MRRWAVGAGVAVAALWMSAVPARSAQVTMVPSGVLAPGAAQVWLQAGPTETTSLVVTGAGVSSGLGPTALVLADLAGTFTTIPGPVSGPTAPQVPCTVSPDGHLATCSDPGGIGEFLGLLGSGDDRVVAGSGSVAQPHWVIQGGAGNDFIAAPLASVWGGRFGFTDLRGDAGNDTLIVGPAPLSLLTGTSTPGAQVIGGDGNDLIETVDGLRDGIDCGAGTDTLIADPTEGGAGTDGFSGSPTGCETRVP